MEKGLYERGKESSDSAAASGAFRSDTDSVDFPGNSAHAGTSDGVSGGVEFAVSVFYGAFCPFYSGSLFL